jgi:hypothetical protein
MWYLVKHKENFNFTHGSCKVSGYTNGYCTMARWEAIISNVASKKKFFVRSGDLEGHVFGLPRAGRFLIQKYCFLSVVVSQRAILSKN